MTRMTPDEAREHLEASDYPDAQAVLDWALETIAAMTIEEDWRVVPFEEVDGRYETRHRVRLVSEWRDT